MQLARECQTIEDKTATVADLTIRAACDLIATASPNATSEVRKVTPLVPDDGQSLVGFLGTLIGNHLVWISPSDHPGYYYVSHFWMAAPVNEAEDDLPSNMTLTTMKRPVLGRSLAEVVLIVTGMDLTATDWTQQKFTGRTDINPLELYDENAANALWEAFAPGRPPISRPGRPWPRNRKELRRALKESAP